MSTGSVERYFGWGSGTVAASRLSMSFTRTRRVPTEPRGRAPALADDTATAVFAALAERDRAPHVFEAYLLATRGPRQARSTALECLDTAIADRRERWVLEMLGLVRQQPGVPGGR